MARCRRVLRSASASIGSLLLLLVAMAGLHDACAQPDQKESPKGATQPEAAKSEPAAPDAKIAITGSCLIESDAPLPGAKVVLFLVRLGERAIKLAETRSDAAGSYQFSNLENFPGDDPEGRLFYFVAAIAKGRVSRMAVVRSSSAASLEPFEMPPARTVGGRIVDPEGKPVQGADVWSIGTVNSPVEGLMSAQTGADGRFAIADIAPLEDDDVDRKGLEHGGIDEIEIKIRVRHPDFAEKQAPFKLQPTSPDIALEYGGTLEGRLIDTVTGKPASHVLIYLQQAHPREGFFDRATRTDDNGNYRFESMPDAQCNVWAKAPDRACAALESVAVVVRETTRLTDLKLVQGGWLEGRVVNSRNQPLTGGAGPFNRIHIGVHGPSRPKSSPAVEGCVVDNDGRFRIRLPPGKNYPYIMTGDMWERTWHKERLETGVEIHEGETVKVFFRVLDQIPPKEPDPDELLVALPLPIAAERPAAVRIRDLGGWYQLDEDDQVIEVNMVYHYDGNKKRYDNNQTTDEALAVVGKFPRLQTLLLKETQASDKGLEQVGRIEGLERLFIWDGKTITDEGVAHLCRLPNLRYLHLSNSAISDEAIAHLSRITSLEELAMQGNRFTDKAFQYARRMPRLRSLILDNGPQFTDAVFKHVRQMSALETLWLHNTLITDEGLKDLYGLKALKLLRISDKSQVTDEAILELQTANPTLEVKANIRTFPRRELVQKADESQ